MNSGPSTWAIYLGRSRRWSLQWPASPPSRACWWAWTLATSPGWSNLSDGLKYVHCWTGWVEQALNGMESEMFGYISWDATLAKLTSIMLFWIFGCVWKWGTAKYYCMTNFVRGKLAMNHQICERQFSDTPMDLSTNVYNIRQMPGLRTEPQPWQATHHDHHHHHRHHQSKFSMNNKVTGLGELNPYWRFFNECSRVTGRDN